MRIKPVSEIQSIELRELQLLEFSNSPHFWHTPVCQNGTHQGKRDTQFALRQLDVHKNNHNNQQWPAGRPRFCTNKMCACFGSLELARTKIGLVIREKIRNEISY